MRLRGVRPPRKRLRNCATCLTNTKGVADDYRAHNHFDELGLAERDAVSRMGIAPFPVAGNCTRCTSRGRDGGLPPRLDALPGGCGCFGTHVVRSPRDILLLFAAAFRWGRRREV